jgi:cob(I)alamin adenosyltransferase
MKHKPTSIYTKTGDKGMTTLFGGDQIEKYHPQVEAYGTVDELSSYIGLLTVHIKDPHLNTFLVQIQKDLYIIMGILASAKSPIADIEKRVVLFEQKIDELQSELPELHRFILPGTTALSAHFHITRTLCRRTERSIVCAFQEKIKKKTWDTKTEKIIMKYLNRLSDLFFMYARLYAEGKEILT